MQINFLPNVVVRICENLTHFSFYLHKCKFCVGKPIYEQCRMITYLQINLDKKSLCLRIVQ